ncbi:MAG: phosphopantothenoylcysteine decarboxylase, partial [Nanoarchaeota archaeon]
ERLSKFFEKKDSMSGLNILVTAGAFSEQIDPVRILTNKSSGKMGIAIANESLFRGANVTLLRGNTTIEPNENVKDIGVDSAEELLEELKKNKKQDIIIHCAAIPDFKVEKSRKKLSSNKEVMLRLKPAKKILDGIKKINKKVFLVGFKAEYNLNKEQLIKKAYQRLKKAKCDMIVANDIAKGVFSSDKNEVYIIDKNKRITYLPFSQKSLIAERILDEILALHSSRLA